MRKLLILLLLISSASYGQLLTGVAGTVRKPRPPAPPAQEFAFWASFSEDDASPVGTPYITDTGQEMTVVQTASNLFIQGNELKKLGASGYVTNTLTASTATARETGYCLSFRFQYTTGGVIGGFLQSGATAHYFQVSSNKLLASDRFSLSDINYVLTPGTYYTGFLIVRPAGVMWVFNEGNDFYMTYISSKYTYANLNQYLDLSSTSSVDWMRGKVITGAETDFDLDTFSSADASDGMTFTHGDSWIVYSLPTKATTESEIQFRKVDASNYLKLTVNTSNVGKLIEVIEGVETQKGSDFTITQGDEYRIFTNGTDVRIFGNSTTALLVQATTTLSGTDGQVVTQGGGNISTFKVYPFSISDDNLVPQLLDIQSVSEPINDVVERNIYVSSTATSGTGTEGDPYTWTQALGDATPGTTVILQEGTYTNISGTINAFGTAEYPVTIQPEAGKKVTLDFVNDFFVFGSDVVFDGSVGMLELMTDSWTGDRFTTSQTYDLGVFGSRVKFINTIIHDFGNNGVWSSSIGSEFYGNLIYNIGRGNGSLGHPIYTQNATGTKVFENNVIVQTFESNFVFHLYGSSSSVLRGYDINHNMTYGGRFLAGSGGSKVQDIDFLYNVHTGSGQLEIGLFGTADPLHNNFHVNFNKFWGTSFQIKKGADFEVLNNTFVGNTLSEIVFSNLSGTKNIENNDYSFEFNTPTNKWVHEGVGITTFGAWQALGYDAAGSYNSYSPGGGPDEVIVYPNAHNTKRATIAVKNSASASTVSVDVSGITGLVNGDTYYLLNCQNPIEALEFTYTGAAVTVPMTGWTMSTPIGTEGGAMTPRTSMFPKLGFFYLTEVDPYFANVTTNQTASTISVDFDVMVPETPAKPTVETVTITGTEIDGGTLTASYSGYYSASGYADASTWQWYRADDNQSFGSVVLGVTGNTYAETQDDVGKVIRAVIIPTDEIGTVGDPVTSIYTGQIADDEFNPITDIDWWNVYVPDGAPNVATTGWRNDGDGNDATQNGSDPTPTYDAGELAVDFELSSSQELILDQPPTQFTGGVDIWIRCKLESYNGAFGRLLAWTSSQAVEQRGGGGIYLSGGTCDYSVPLNTWVILHFVISQSANTSEFQVNGGTLKTNVAASTAAFGTSNGMIGASANGSGNWLDGKISHIFIRQLNGVRYDTEMNTWFNENAPPD